MTIIEHALDMVPSNSRVGLGSGRTCAGLRQGPRRAHPDRKPTHPRSADLGGDGKSVPEGRHPPGDPCRGRNPRPDRRWGGRGGSPLDLIKGYGRDLVREKIVAASSRRLIILVGDEKLVPQLGTRGKLPVEVVPFALPLCERRLRDLGCQPVPYFRGGSLFVTDNGNHILDCQIHPIPDPARLEMDIRAIPGVVGTGLFLGMADTVLVGDPNDFRFIEERRRGDNRPWSRPAPSRMQAIISGQVIGVAMSTSNLWKRFQQYLCQVPALGLTLDVSRMRFEDGFLERMAAPMRAGIRGHGRAGTRGHRQSGREPHGGALLAPCAGPGPVAGNRRRDPQAPLAEIKTVRCRRA